MTQPKKNLDFYYKSKLHNFSMLNMPFVFSDIQQPFIVRSLAYLASNEPYCNTGCIIFQMTDQELRNSCGLFVAAEKELEPYLSGNKTLAQCKNLNAISILCFILARLEGETEIKKGVLQAAFPNLGKLIHQELKYRHTKTNTPDYSKMSILN